MSALKAIFSRLRSGEGQKPLAATNGRRHLPDRRKFQRRGKVLPFESPEARLRFAAQAAGFGTYDLDCLDGNSHCSPELRVLAGLPEADAPVSLEDIRARVHPEDRDGFAQSLQASLDGRGGGELETECRLQRPDGTVRWVKVKGRTFFVESGEGRRRPLRAAGMVMDITERRRVEEALRQSKKDLELAVRGADIGIWSWDLRTGQVELSERCRQLFGIPAGGVLNVERVLAAIHPDDRGRVEAALRQALAKREEYKIEKRFVWPDASVHWLECIGRDLYDETGHQAVGMRGITLDITERKRREEALLGRNEQLQSSIEDRTAELIRANEALERSNLELQQFAYIAAHDLQTPLRSISGFAQLLQMDYQGRLDARADVWLNHLVRAVHRMRDVIHDILNYSRVESRGGAFQPTDFRRLFDDVLATLDAPIRETGARVTRGDLPVASGDRTQLAQVLQNLIDNGLKYHRPGVPPEVHVSARRQGEEWLFSVRDNGIGIAGKHLEQIFGIFRRLHTQEEYPGTGIGLAICRRVIHRHGGRIWAESQPGQGSLFRFTLPVGRQGERP